MKQRLVLVLSLLLLNTCPCGAKQAAGGYLGLEYFGSSQLSKLEMEKQLGLHPGASYQSGLKAIEHLQEKLAHQRIKANVDIANEGESYFVTVDVMDTGLPSVPVRNLRFPHHIALDSDVPFTILNDIMIRRESLATQGRPVTESFADGIKHFSDEPCEQYGAKLLRQVPAMRNQLLNVISSDPDPTRRSKAIEVLNWDSDPVQACVDLIPAIDDASEQVRASAARFLYPRIKMLPEDFPWPDLVEAFSHQLARPSHIDRLLALRCLVVLAKTNGTALHAIKVFDEDRLQEIEHTSVVPAVKQPAQQLLALTAKVQKESKARSEPAELKEF